MAVKRRIWSDEEKRSICLQASTPGISVAQVAQRYSMNANLIFKWLRDVRFSPDVNAGRNSDFLPVEISQRGLTDETMASDAISPVSGVVRIELAGGHRIVAEGGFDPNALGQLLKGWLS
jgi:transposase